LTPLVNFLYNVSLKEFRDIKPYKDCRITTSLYSKEEIEQNIKPTQLYIDDLKYQYWDNVCKENPLRLMSNRIEIIDGILNIPVVCERTLDGILYVADGHHRLYAAMNNNCLCAVTEVSNPLVTYYAKPTCWNLVNLQSKSKHVVRRDYIVSHDEGFSRLFYRDFNQASIEILGYPMKSNEQPTKKPIAKKGGKKQ